MVHNLLEKIRYRIIHGGLFDARYPESAYYFVVTGIEKVQLETGVKRHYTGDQLTLSFLRIAFEYFGILALDVLRNWGIRDTRDFGNIVYNCIDAGIMKKQDSDSIEDFNNVVDIEEYLDKFLSDSPDVDREYIRRVG